MKRSVLFTFAILWLAMLGPVQARDASIAAHAERLLHEATHALNGNGNGNGNGGANHQAAASLAVARYVIYAHFFPEEEPGFTMDLARAVADMPEDDAKAAGMREGRRVAERVLR